MVKKLSFHPKNSGFLPKTQFKIEKTQFFRNFKSVDIVGSVQKKPGLVLPFAAIFKGIIFLLPEKTLNGQDIVAVHLTST